MEIKRVTEDFGDRSLISWTPDEIKCTMDTIETLFEECDAELAKAGMSSLGYEKQDIGTMIEHMVILIGYVYDAHPQCYCELDKPLFKAFKNGATETLSNIVLDDITTENTFGMQEYVEVPETVGSWYMTEVKTKLTMSDFLGLEEVTPESGIPTLENVETLGWFTNLFRADYQNMAGSLESVDQMLEIYLHSGEYSHKEYHPVGNFISGILDITIVKPFIESIVGTDLITGEKLTDFERGMQLVNAIVGAVTFGQGALALDLTEMAGKEIAVELLKIWAVDAISDTAAYTVGYTCDELGLPAGVSFIASLLTGCTVSVKSGKYILQDADRNVVKELDADGMKALLKEMDVDLEDLVGGKTAVGQTVEALENVTLKGPEGLLEPCEVLVFGSGEFSYTIPIKGYTDWVDGMSKTDAVNYITNNEVVFFNEFSERARAAGLDNTQIVEAFCSMRGGDYTKMASYFDTSSPVDGAVFWSGNKEAAAAYANSIGGTVLEQTPGGQIFDDWRGLGCMYPGEWGKGGTLDQQPIWEALSTQYANGAVGNVTYIVPEWYNNSKSMWLKVEQPAINELMRNGIVTDITTIIIKE